MDIMIRIGIAGFGNLGRGLLKAIEHQPDMEPVVVLSRRSPDQLGLRQNITVAPLYEAGQWQDKVDVMILCGGSATDLPEQGPQLARYFHTVDSFDTHAHIPDYFNTMNQSAVAHEHLALISCGWDPGLFSIMRTVFGSILPDGQDHTFWGAGVSQGHSDAIRRIPGVIDARQYTIPIAEAVTAARSRDIELNTRQKHRRECYVVAADGADQKAIEAAIVTMPNYFADYDTTVTFISAEMMQREHDRLPHGGSVIRRGRTSASNNQTVEFSLKLDSNPEFTASVLAAYARAVYRLASQGRRGALTVLDIAPGLLSPLTPEQLRKEIL